MRIIDIKYEQIVIIFEEEVHLGEGLSTTYTVIKRNNSTTSGHAGNNVDKHMYFQKADTRTHRTTRVIPRIHHLYRECNTFKYSDVSSCDKYNGRHGDLAVPYEFSFARMRYEGIIYGKYYVTMCQPVRMDTSPVK